jgi:hypothetical protein
MAVCPGEMTQDTGEDEDLSVRLPTGSGALGGPICQVS